MERELKALIVDDDKSARLILSKFLEINGNVILASSVSTTNEAMQAIETIMPDVIFLDINMPMEDGLQFAERLRMNNIEVPIVFTTAYKNYALSAISVKPLDYLVKPFGLDDVFNVLDKVEKEIDNKIELYAREKKSGLRNPDAIRFIVSNGFVFIKPSDIFYIRVFGSKSEVMMNNGESKVLSLNMNEVADELKHFNFFRINRSAVINLKYIDRIDKKARICFIKYNNDEVGFLITHRVLNELDGINTLKLG